MGDASETAWILYTDTIALVIAAPILVSMLQFKQRARALYFVVMLTTMLFTMNISKLFYHEPRPFWVSPQIEAMTCSTQYGNPSGHSLFAMGTALTIWLDYNATVTNTCFWGRWYTRLALLIAALTFGVTIGYSRVVLGVHSWNQLLFGWQLGAWMALTLHYCCRDKLHENVQQLFYDRDTDFVSLAFKWLSLLAIVLVVQIVNYVVKEPWIVNDPVWEANIVAKCP